MSKTKRVKLADVLWRAANECLDTKQPNMLEDPRKPTSYLTCNSIAKVLDPRSWWSSLPEEIKQFLKSLGCPISSPDGFNDFERGEERQGVRYMWLLLAMHVAADEDIEVEVQA